MLVISVLVISRKGSTIFNMLSIDAHRGRGREAPHEPFQKTSKNLEIKMQKILQLDNPPPCHLDLRTTPMNTLVEI
jgi:hypothetical protein